MSYQNTFCENHAQVSVKFRYRSFVSFNLGLMAGWGLFGFETLQELQTDWVVFRMLGLAFWSLLLCLPMIAFLMYIGLVYFGAESLVFRSKLESWLE